jgi:hypothetical protein
MASRALPANCFTLDYSSTPKLEARCSSKTSVNIQQTVWCYIPKGRTPQITPLSFKELYNSSLSSQELAGGPYPEPDKTNPHPYTQFF